MSEVCVVLKCVRRPGLVDETEDEDFGNFISQLQDNGKDNDFWENVLNPNSVENEEVTKELEDFILSENYNVNFWKNVYISISTRTWLYNVTFVVVVMKYLLFLHAQNQ